MLYWLALENYRIEATAVYENRNYFDQTHDAHHLGLELSHIYDFARPGTYLRLDKRLSNEFAGDEGYLLAGVSLSGGVAVWRGLRIDGGLGYAHYWFENRPAAQIGQVGDGDFSRQDNQFQINAKICYQFSPAWEVGFDYVLTLNDSNVEGGQRVRPLQLPQACPDPPGFGEVLGESAVGRTEPGPSSWPRWRSFCWPGQPGPAGEATWAASSGWRGTA